MRAVVLVEGVSDQVALEALAARRGRNLEAERVSVVPIGGAQAIGRFLNRFGPQGLDVRLAGLCDAAEEGDFRRGLERAQASAPTSVATKHLLHAAAGAATLIAWTAALALAGAAIVGRRDVN